MARGPARGSLIAIDTAVFIYHLEKHAQFGAIAGDILGRVETGTNRGVISALVLAELLAPAWRAGDAARANGVASAIQSMPNLTVQPANSAICIEAARLRGELGLKTPDAIRLATALISRARSFVTNDRQLKRLARPGLTVWLLTELMPGTIP